MERTPCKRVHVLPGGAGLDLDLKVLPSGGFGETVLAQGELGVDACHSTGYFRRPFLLVLAIALIRDRGP